MKRLPSNANPLHAIAFALLCIALPAQAQIQSTDLTAAQIPPGLPIKGHAVVGIRWKDARGDNVVVLSQTGVQSGKGAPPEVGSRGAALYAAQFRLVSGKWVAGWKLSDYVADCEVDVPCAFVKHSLEVTDVDRDDVGEVSFVYRLDCIGDVEAWGQKLIVYQDNTKYAIRGRSTLYGDEGEPVDGGQMKVDASLAQAPAAIRKYALRKWKRFDDHALPTFDEDR